MKKIVIGISLIFLVSSCQLRMATAETASVATSLVSKNTAELNVSSEKVSIDYNPTKQERKSGLNLIKSNAVSTLLEKNGNADVLVHPQYSILKKKYLLRSKIISVRVSGYPAFIKNVKPAEPDKIIVNQMVNN